MNKNNKLAAAVIGFGYWGPNLARNLIDNENFDLKYICDSSARSRKLATQKYPQIKITNNSRDVFSDKSISTVFIATPPSTHFALAKEALNCEKNVLVEKPLACNSLECPELLDLANRNGCVLMVDHTFAYTGAVRKMRELSSSSIGELLYYDSVRINLGLFQKDVNVLWDLAVHDLAILDNICHFKPTAVSATGHAHVKGYPCNTAYLTLFYKEPFIAHIHCSWMAPVKIRKTLVGGSQKMLVYDDLEPTEKVKVYDKGITINPQNQEKYDLRVDYRSADIFIPKLDSKEALGLMLDEFYKSIYTGSPPLTDAQSGLRMVSILEGADLSLSQNGKPIDLHLVD